MGGSDGPLMIVNFKHGVLRLVTVELNYTFYKILVEAIKDYIFIMTPLKTRLIVIGRVFHFQMIITFHTSVIIIRLLEIKGLYDQQI